MAAEARPARRYWTIAISLAVILFLTLFPTDGRRSPDSFWCIRCSGYASHADLILNVLLFVPFGLSLRQAGARLRSAIPIVVTTTVAIELLQYLFIPGRDATVRDCITNSVGGLGAFVVYPWIHQLWNADRAVARTLAAVATVLWSAHSVLAVIAFRPAATNANYYGQVLLEQAGFNPFRGKVERPALNGIPVFTDRLSPPAATAARSLGAITISADVFPEATTYGIAPIVKIADGDGNEIAMLAQHRDAALMRLRVKANRLGLRAPSLDLPGALSPGRPVHLAAGRTGYTMHIEVVRPGGGREHGTLRLTPSLGWSLWWPFDMYSTSHLRAFAWLWLGFPMLAIGFWSARAFTGPVKALLAMLMAAVVSQVAAPLALGGLITSDPMDGLAMAIAGLLGLMLGLRKGARAASD